jgi:hypothetical protein
MIKFINAIRKSDKYIEMIYMNGGCYQFHLLLKTFFPDCTPFINADKNHVITKHEGKFFDITGEVSGDNYSKMTESDIDIAKEWSFHKTKVIQISKCPVCGEPIVI